MRLNVGVIFGGKSVEHEVSIITAIQMIENMDKSLYNPITIYLSKENDFFYSEKMMDISFFKDLENVKKESKRVNFNKNNNKLELSEIIKSRIKKVYEIDIIFLVVHGNGCEDGTLSGYFELLDVPYVGSNILSSAINQNKWIMKQILELNNIKVVEYYGFYESDFYQNESNVLNCCEKIGYPLIVKPATLGSSVGITKCYDKESLHKAILTALQYDYSVVVEKVIENLIELNVSVLGDCNDIEVSEIERVKGIDEILSYNDKYLRGGKENVKGMACTNRELPAKINDDLRIEIQDISIKATKIIGGSGVARIDFLYDKNESKLYLNEINTIPGSLAFYLWNAKGIEYQKLINRLIQLGLSKYRTRNTKIFSYESNLLSLPHNFNKGKLS